MTYPADVLALITGGASGIGAATAIRLRAAGVRVVTADLAPGADRHLDVADPDAVTALVADLGPVGILVHSAAPAAVAAPVNAATDPAILARSQSLTPMGRFGRPDGIAEPIAWLCSEQIGSSTGAVYDVSGGRATY